MDTLRHSMLSFLVLSFITSRAVAQADGKQMPIWMWDDDARIATRLDPTAIAQRLAAHRLQIAAQPGTGRIAVQQASDMAEFVIDGNRNPELFLRFELYESLLNAVDPNAGEEKDRRALRERYAPRLQALGFDARTFWTDLARMATPYSTGRTNRDAIAIQADSAPVEERRQLRTQLDELPRQLCRARFDSLNAARTHFGPAKFDEFLYTAVAPTLHMASAKPSAGTAAGLKMLAEGCHD